jgi:beta-fructofuranosidase
MPVSIWNDQPYDESAIYTGSATIVDGKVVQVYPGLCNTKGKDCPGGTNLCIAKPADPSDPLQTNWTKDAKLTGAVNPIFPNTGRDPSTAWKTKAGEWRLTTFDTNIYASMDFNKWYKIGPQPNFPHGECPSFFELPATTPGAGPAPAGSKTYSHVHKASHGGDWMQVGNYIENGIRQNGNWSAEKEVKIDMGHFYASKDFYDPVMKRRINWGWAQVPPGSTQTLPREITWNPELQQLVYSPVVEQDKLRGDVLGTLGATEIKPNTPVPIGAFPAHVGKQSEVDLTFAIPSEAAKFGVVVMGDNGAQPSKGTLFYIDYKPPTKDRMTTEGVHIVSVGAESVGATDGGTVDTLKISPNDRSITLRVYVDNTFCEAYWQHGRVAMTITTAATTEATMSVMSTDSVSLESAKAWRVNSIWVSPKDVINTPRKDGKA